MSHSNEVQRLHFEIKRLNVQLSTLRDQFKHLVGEFATARHDCKAWATKAGVLEAKDVSTGDKVPGNPDVPTGVSKEVP